MFLQLNFQRVLTSSSQGGSDVVEASGSYDCFKHKADNAQNYAWLAGVSILETEAVVTGTYYSR